MSWNNNISFPNWAGSAIVNNYEFPSISSINISSSNISTYNLTAYNGYVSYMSNITTTTNAVILQPATILTGNNGALYINGLLVYTASNFSNIGEWSRFAAVSDVDLSYSNINNVGNIFASNAYWGKNLYVSTVNATQINSSNISNANQITTKNLIGTSGVAAPTVQGVNVSGVYGSFPTLVTTDFTSSTQSNANLLKTRLLKVYDTAEVDGTLTVGLDIQGNTVIRVPEMRSSYNYVYKELRVAPIFPVSPDIGTIISPSTIVTDTLIARNSISTILISTGSLFANTIDVGSNIVVPDIVCSNITVVDTATVETLNVEGTATIYTLENTFGANFQGGASVENELNVNCDVNFPFNSTSDPLVLPPNTQPLYDMSYIRNITCGGLYVQGGWNGNTVLPPYHNNTSVTIGNDGGITSPAVVVINGQNPGFGENLTNALTVRGDMAVDFGTLTTYNGLVCEPFNEEANAIEVNGITALNGLVNILGATTIEGSTGILGNTTITGAVEVTGGCLFTGGLAQQAGDWTLGNFGTGYTGIINTATTINGSLNMAGFNVNNVGTLTASNIFATNLTTCNINYVTSNTFANTIQHLSTNTIVVYQDLSGEDIVGSIGFSDISGNQSAFIGLGPDSPYPLAIASLNSIATFAVGSIVTDAGVNMELTAQANATLTGVSNVTMQTGGNATVVGLGTATLHGYNSVSIISDDGGIGLDAETGDISLTAGCNFNVVANNYIYCQATNECAISTIKITLTRDVYMSNIYGIGGTNIRVNDNINMSNSVLYAGAVQTDNVYTPIINGPFGSSNAINVVNPLNMTNNNISNVNKMYYGATRQPFIQFGSNNTGATGTTVTLPVSYANANYAVQLTYIGIPGGSQSLYLISQTTSNFRFHGHNNSPTYWTTLGFNN